MRLLPALIALAIPAFPVHALRYEQIVGTWKGGLLERSPTALYRNDASIQIRPYGKGGVSTVLRLILLDVGNSRVLEARRLYPTGSSALRSSFDGTAFASGSGTWVSGRNSLRVRTSLTYWDGALGEEKLILTFRGRRLSYRASFAGGITVAGTLKRTSRR